MSRSSQWPLVTAGDAFDGIAQEYDQVFTRSVIGRAQRAAVWEVLEQAFRRGDRVLELNCGTGEDALFLGRQGISVQACDASSRMIEVARRRKMEEAPGLDIEFTQLATERIAELNGLANFDGVLSDFAGLNCSEDLRRTAFHLSNLVHTGAKLVLCLASRVCIWEFMWFAAHGNVRKAIRRFRGSAVGHVAGRSVRVWYPRIIELERAFFPWFALRASRAVGLLVPPSCLESWASKHPKAIALASRVDRACGHWPLLRALGDHILLEFERVRA